MGWPAKGRTHSEKTAAPPGLRVSRMGADDGFGPEAVVDLVEQVVVGEVVEPEREAGGRKEDLLAGFFSAQELRRVLDHGAHDGERRHRARVDRTGPRLRPVRVAGGQG